MCAAFGLNGAQNLKRIERFAWINHGCSMAEASEITHDHAETMIEWDRDAHSVAETDAGGVTDLNPVVEQIVMGQRYALWKPSRAACKLNVHSIVDIQRRSSLEKRCI